MNIREYVRNILTNEEILNLTEDKKVYFLTGGEEAKPTYVCYQIIDEYGSFFEENEEVITAFNVQVDIFSKGSYSQLEQIIKDKMKQAGFYRGMAADLYENDTGLYHKAMRFSINLSK
ncbi:prohead protease [Proteiniborus sp. MB09-C3]|uniref:prohead protease n=1 Tax=Proteiniborus sp. MB09-C3 TaxID=3050072 RepID=UPI0025521896|nr:prohead protease [Proteiniborus sp. MB09-C3]WIV10542.1 prohead protease [Proteiniborus sp. MB09-C3]